MKTVIRTILCAAAVVLAAVSCQKSIEPANPVEEGKGTIDISVNGLMGEYTQVDQSKAQLVNNVRVSWEGDETVYVFDGVKCLGSLAASLEGDEDRYAILSTDGAHTVSTPADGTTTLTLVYSPLLTEAPTVNDGAISISLASQSGEKAPFVAYATLNYTSTTITNAVVPFKFATSVIKVNCTGLKANTAISSATLSNVNTACKLTLSGDKAPVVAGGTNGTITRTGDSYFAAGKVNSEGEAVFQIAVPKLETASGARILTVAQGSGKVEDKNFSMKGIEPATSVNTVCQLVKALPAGALPGVFTVSPEGKKVHFSQGNLTYDEEATTNKWKFYEHQYDCAANGDASSTLISLFTWGHGDWSTNPTTTTYLEGHTSDGDPFDPSEDWGSQIGDGKTWCTLTTAEWEYLFKTDTPNRMVNGKPCYSNAMSGVTIGGATYKGIFLYPDDYSGKEVVDNTETWTWDKINSAGIVFLPAAGWRDGSIVDYVGDMGYYWSSSAHDEDYAYLVYFAYFNSKYFNPVSLGLLRSGYSVRLITDVK